MRGILDSLDKNYLASYEAAIASLFSCSEDFVTSVLIVSELSELKNYFNHLFGLLFKFPQLSHYRPILLFFILEIDKCVTQFIEWQQLHTHNPKLSSSFLGSIGHIDKPHLTKELQRLFDDFVKYRSGLLDLMSNESLFSNYQDITDFKHEITDTVELLARCK
jgi:hypothetical protein